MPRAPTTPITLCLDAFKDKWQSSAISVEVWAIAENAIFYSCKKDELFCFTTTMLRASYNTNHPGLPQLLQFTLVVSLVLMP
jgi:hypothetical protein